MNTVSKQLVALRSSASDNRRTKIIKKARKYAIFRAFPMPKILKRLAGFDQIWRGFYGFIGVKIGANSLFFVPYGFKPGLTFTLFRTSKSHIFPQLHRVSAHSFFKVNGRRLYFFAQKSGRQKLEGGDKMDFRPNRKQEKTKAGKVRCQHERCAAGV